MSFYNKFLLVAVLLSTLTTGIAQKNYWTDVSPVNSTPTQKRLIVPEKARTILLDQNSLSAFLKEVPLENTLTVKDKKSILSIPMPYGNFQNFFIVETAIMEPGLAAAVPEIKTYSGQGIDDPTATITIDVNRSGFHAMILSNEGAVFIDPYNMENDSHYIAYYKKDFKTFKRLIEPGYKEPISKKGNMQYQARTQTSVCIGGTLKKYRLAVACTGEYAVAVNATTPQQALSAIVTTVNRVNGIYEKELAIRLVLVANNLKIVFVNAATDKFKGNDDAGILIDESQKVITDSIGSANFDIGHTFSTGGGGLAGLGVVCTDAEKAMGITGSQYPAGDPYDVDFVAHEMGHQFGAYHTFNGNTGNCSQNSVSFSNVEPGSGSTIMAYAGICDANDLQPNSDPQFHGISLEQISSFIAGSGNTCAVQYATGNRAPVVNAGLDYTIPKSTPFILQSAATDADNDPITYSWEQKDIGGPYGNATSPSNGAPLFRSFPPVASGTRFFPKLSNLVSNTATIGEMLPTYGRNINFKLTARDNRMGGGGVCSDDMVVKVDPASGPFIVTAPNTATTWDAGTFKTVTWNVAGSNLAPVNCANVTIQLSTDGGYTFPVTLIANTPNDGSEEIKVPEIATSQARIRVMAVDNIFFDISNANFTIKNAGIAEFIFDDPSPVLKCDGVNVTIILKTNGTAGFINPITLSSNGAPAGATVAFSNNPILPGNDVAVTLKGTVAPGEYVITINGVSGSLNKSKNLTFRVGPSTATSTLNSPENNAASQPETPTFNWSAINEASGYKLEISTVADFATLFQSVPDINATTYTLVNSLNANTQYYWRVSANNGCGAGSPSTVRLFKTASTTCNPAVISTTTKTISATGTPTVTSSITISSGVVISDINVVSLKGTHSYISDLTFKLKSPANDTIVLFDQICNDEMDFDLNLDDEADTDIFPCPVTGSVFVRPTQPLSRFIGKNSSGTWTLIIKDNFADDGGRLTSWGLRICSQSATPLPVNWLTFTAQKASNNNVALQWSTANEVNNHHYDVERSADGINFNSLGTIAGGTNVTMMQTYLFNDLKPFSGVNYYCLKQVDRDGKFTYSAIVKVDLEGSRALYTVYPNPAINHSTINILSNLSKVNISLTDASGKTVYQQYLATAKIGEQIHITVKGIAKGVYFLNVAAVGVNKADKIIIQ